MLRVAGITVCAIVLALLVLTGSALATEGWQTFTHPQLGFSVSYPDGWAPAKGPSGVVFMAVGPAPAGVQGFRMNVNVTSEEIPATVNLENYEAQNEAGLGLLFAGYRRLRKDSTMIGAYPAVVRYYVWKRTDGVELYQIQLVTIAGSRGYVVTGTTTTASTHLADDAKLLVSILVTFRPQ